MSLAIRYLTACSRAEGLSDIMARHMDKKEVEKENNVTKVFGAMVKIQIEMYQATLVAKGR